MVVRELEAAGYSVRHVGRWPRRAGRACQRLARSRHPRLDAARLDGLEVLRQIRQIAPTPVLMLTARSEETDRVIGLEVGADDYLTKPFSMRELIARVRALLRRQELLRQMLAADRDGEPSETLTRGRSGWMPPRTWRRWMASRSTSARPSSPCSIC